MLECTKNARLIWGGIFPLDRPAPAKYECSLESAIYQNKSVNTLTY